MAVLIDAIDVKRKTFFEIDNTPFACMEVEVNTPTARGGQTLVRLKVRNLLTNAVFERTFKAGEKFKEPDLQLVSASYLYSDGSGSHFLDQQTYETHTLSEEAVGDALDFLTEGVAQVQRQSHRLGIADFRRAESHLHGTGCAGRVVKRRRHQAGHAGDRSSDPRPTVYQRRGKGKSVDGKPGVCGAGLTA
jgi:translation elongation factor P/translation initiation factor 5A